MASQAQAIDLKRFKNKDGGKFNVVDTIATLGKFPRFCVNTYKWFNRTFNSYDSLYVVGHGRDFTIRPALHIWWDDHLFLVPGEYPFQMTLATDPFMQVGIKGSFKFLNYTYQFRPTSRDKKGLSKYFGVGITLNMLDIQYHHHKNEVGTTLSSLKYKDNILLSNIPYDGFTSSVHTLDIHYFFNHHKYSRSAAFQMGRIQKKSSGSFFLGTKIESHKLAFDMAIVFKKLEEKYGPFDDGETVPDTAVVNFDYMNYHITGGYGHNFVLGKGWIIGLCDAVSLGLTRGIADGDNVKRSQLGFANKASLAIGWNNPRLFVNLTADFMFCSYKHTNYYMFEGYGTAQLAVGYRFSLWGKNKGW